MREMQALQNAFLDSLDEMLEKSVHTPPSVLPIDNGDGTGEEDTDSDRFAPPTISKSQLSKYKSVSIFSPLRYPGSKRKLAYYIKRMLHENNIHPKLFVEPFAGGASVALQLLNDRIVDKVGLIEKDVLVSSFWSVLFDHNDTTDAEWLIEQVMEMKVSLERWHEFKETEPMDFAGRKERALACLFLNRTSFSGILAPMVGPIGGKNQISDYKIDCRFPRETLVRRIRQIMALGKRVEFVIQGSWSEGMEFIRCQQEQRIWTDVFFYFDPPFFEKAHKSALKKLCAHAYRYAELGVSSELIQRALSSTLHISN